MRRGDISAKLTRCPGLQKTSNAKFAFETNDAALKDAVRIFPFRKYFTISGIEFVKECQEITAGGRDSIDHYTSILNRIMDRRDGGDIIDTLTTFLLDQNSSITETAANLFVHKNTVKYRLQKASDILGFRVGDVPQSKKLLYALALRRLLSCSALPGK